MAVCKFFLEGRCKFGDRCKFEHPRSQDPRNQNTAGTFARPDNNQSRGAPRNQSSATGNYNHSRYPYHLNPDIIRDDLTKERPLWIMSSYGPGRDAPTQLFGGFPLEQSPEEIRMLHYLAIASGNPQQSIQTEQELAATSNQHVQSALNDLNGAIQYIQNGAKNHPNRLDFCAQNRFAEQFYNEQIATQKALPVSQGTTFGQPTTFAQTQPALQTQPAPQFSQQGFAPANNFNQQTPQPIPATFGQQAQQSTQSAFNQTPQLNVPFGQPSQLQQTNIASNLASQPNTFGSPAAQPFGHQQNALPQSNVFGQNNSQPQANVGFAQSQINSQFPVSGGIATIPSQDLNAYSTRDATGKLLTWKTRPVVYLETGEPCFQKPDGSLERIWFPDGPPNKFQADDIGEVAYSGNEEARYRFLRENGAFEGGVMPEIPPKVEDVRWDL